MWQTYCDLAINSVYDTRADICHTRINKDANHDRAKKTGGLLCLKVQWEKVPVTSTGYNIKESCVQSMSLLSGGV